MMLEGFGGHGHGDGRDLQEERSLREERLAPILCRDVGFRFRLHQGALSVLESVDFSIEDGSIGVLVGPSGCGKTTLLNLLAGFYRPTKGEISSYGKPITGPSSSRTVVFQDHALFDWMTVAGNIRAGLHSASLSRQEKEGRIDELIDLVELEGFASSYPRELSGGMRQRAGLARALAPRPKVILLDEPLASLDALTREELQEELRAILKSDGVTAFLITHDIEEAVLLGDRIFVMGSRPGTIVNSTVPRLQGHRSRLSDRFSDEVVRIRRLAMDAFRGSSDGESHQLM